MLGPLLLTVLLFLVFQAVFAWAEGPKNLIEAGTAWLGAAVGSALPGGSADAPARSIARSRLSTFRGRDDAP